MSLSYYVTTHHLTPQVCRIFNWFTQENFFWVMLLSSTSRYRSVSRDLKQVNVSNQGYVGGYPMILVMKMCEMVGVWWG